MDRHCLIFDIDGVLIESCGYRKAVQETVSHFFQSLGIAGVAISNSEIDIFEAQGITSEWDITPLFIAAWLEANVKAGWAAFKIKDWQDIGQIVESIPSDYQSPEKWFKLFGLFLSPPEYPSTSILNKFRSGGTIHHYFPFLAANMWILEEILENTRNLDKSGIMRFFQEIVLGTAVFRGFGYLNGHEPKDSFINRYDKALITETNVEKILHLVQRDWVHASIMTARPCANPIDGLSFSKGTVFFPEAELGIQNTGLTFLPIVGYGNMLSLGLSTHHLPDFYVKPAAAHAFWALFRAFGIDDLSIYQFLRETLIHDHEMLRVNIRKWKAVPSWLFDSILHVHIFEDSAIGIQAVRKLQALFFRNGIYLQVHPYGIATTQAKGEALLKENAVIYASVNQAFAVCEASLALKSA